MCGSIELLQLAVLSCQKDPDDLGQNSTSNHPCPEVAASTEVAHRRLRQLHDVPNVPGERRLGPERLNKGCCL